MRSSSDLLLSIIHFIPLRKSPESFQDPILRSEAIITFQAGAVRISDRNIAGLHAYELPVDFGLWCLLTPKI